MKVRKKGFRFLITLSILGLIILHFLIPRLITDLRNPIIGLIKRNKPVKVELVTDTSSQFQKKDFKVISFDDIEISGRLTFSKVDSAKGTIILIHGIRSSKNYFDELSTFLAKEGFNSVAIDLRAHGESGGQFCTFGVKEKKDVKSVVDYLLEKEKLSNIGVWGQSLGGAVALQSLGFDKRIKFGIVESTFSDFKSIVNDYFDYHIGFSFKPLSNYLSNRAATIAEFDPDDAQPIKYCKTINQPILIVHGNLDKRININYGKQNFSAIPSKEKEFLEIERANHLNVWKIGGDKYFTSVLQFLESQSNLLTDLSKK